MVSLWWQCESVMKVVMVSWIRRKDLHVLTTGNFTYTTDTRFRALHLPGSPFWSLEVDRPAITDSGLYECQVSTQPKIFRRFRLSVVVPSARITGSREIFMKAGSDINITCVVKGAIRGAPVTWYHVLPRDPPKEELVEINAGGRGGVQLVTDKNSGTSWLLLTHATWRDAGNYTCAPVHATPASVSVHVLDEAPAELQNDPQPSWAQTSTQGTPGLLLLLLGFHRLLGRDGGRTWCLWTLLTLCLVLPSAVRGTSGLQDASQTSKAAEGSLTVAARDGNRVLGVTLLRKQELGGPPHCVWRKLSTAPRVTTTAPRRWPHKLHSRCFHPTPRCHPGCRPGAPPCTASGEGRESRVLSCRSSSCSARRTPTWQSKPCGRRETLLATGPNSETSSLRLALYNLFCNSLDQTQRLLRESTRWTAWDS
ncbi:uncharacterized protein LOC127000131 [Eriocheir sinensis]|uniref:uncharacterized protein LOC127000131 n=1 Tax=Eriocheir sinensis TaxID=95602 RepID=UPI0021C804A0|nr:uncharacterized protein LOC127000131 [Eriocheir sinensis]